MLADPASPYAQPDAAVAFGWALDHALELAPTVGALVVVDVLRFTTCVSVACARGATIFPYEWNDNRAQAFAARHGAQLAGLREHGHLSLSPTDLLDVPAGLRLVLPSPNGSAIAYRAADAGTQVIA